MENAVLFRGVIGTWWTGYVFFVAPQFLFAMLKDG